MTSRAAVFFNFSRYYSQEIRRRVKWKDAEGNLEGKKYGLIRYFPRKPDHVDPPIQPSKLLLVRRVKPFKGNPHWEKKILNHLGFKDESHVNDPSIVKNTPNICAMLWKVKHLVKIVPIKLPDKLPTPDDINGTYLHENGTFYVVPKVDPAREEALEKFVNDPKKLNYDIIQEKLRLKWLEGRP
ncbi:39S ribosomal protein L30, mitochondrial [Camponotus floridanus]|uniref:Large ribosomal subunit protein uL30m n=1 Tax=Camponotus floridanus TaxID=104421 RepID=E2AJD1_CAMFO|nr:39S ribosomal protein L30, mitochondrial [Camponotus floridanus]EFN66452.1 39S ribosomal protein L30, mitochondrial [Camponotus floridanus]